MCSRFESQPLFALFSPASPLDETKTRTWDCHFSMQDPLIEQQLTTQGQPNLFLHCVSLLRPALPTQIDVDRNHGANTGFGCVYSADRVELLSIEILQFNVLTLAIIASREKYAVLCFQEARGPKDHFPIWHCFMLNLQC